VIIHDLLCHECGHEATSVPISGGNFPMHCGKPMKWIPSGFVTDVRGSEQTTQVLCEPDNPSMPLKWTSSRERDAKMKAQGFVPAGDRVNGAIGNSDPAKGRSYVFPSDKTSVRKAKR